MKSFFTSRPYKKGLYAGEYTITCKNVAITIRHLPVWPLQSIAPLIEFPMSENKKSTSYSYSSSLGWIDAKVFVVWKTYSAYLHMTGRVLQSKCYFWTSCHKTSGTVNRRTSCERHERCTVKTWCTRELTMWFCWRWNDYMTRMLGKIRVFFWVFPTIS